MKARLLIDAGNTRIKVRGLAAAEQGPAHPDTGGPSRPAPLTDLGERPTPRDAPGQAALADWLAGLDAPRAGRPVLVTVVPELIAVVRGALPEVVVVDHDSPLPFGLGVTDPRAVGADRYANMAAARGAGLADALVIDAGTATTCDVLADGVFVGGVIAPGLALAGAALAERTARLPAVPLQRAPLAAAPDTRGAMAAGIWHAGRGGVLHLRDGLLAHHGQRPVVVTGGLGGHLADLGWHDPDWTLRGAAVLAGACGPPA